MGGYFQALLAEPLAKNTHNAPDAALYYAVRDYTDKSSMAL